MHQIMIGILIMIGFLRLWGFASKDLLATTKFLAYIWIVVYVIYFCIVGIKCEFFL